MTASSGVVLLAADETAKNPTSAECGSGVEPTIDCQLIDSMIDFVSHNAVPINSEE